MHAAKLHDHFFQRLEFQHIQLDELWANVRQASREVWIWTTLDVTTKIVPVVRLGSRTLAVAYAMVHELRQRMLPSHTLPVFTTDGLRLYFYALTAHFGHWITPAGSRKRVWPLAADFIYGQVKKLQRRRRLFKVELQMLGGEWSLLRSRLKAIGLTGRLNIAFIERLNLTLRQGVALLTRRTWGTAQHMSELALHVEWWRAYYHFARYPEALRIERATPRPRKGRQLACHYRSQTPAMAAGVTTRRWIVIQLISYPLI